MASLIPTFLNPCELATDMPELIAEFLQLDSTLGRRFREESVSDIIVASLRQLPGIDLVVILPQESVTGSDFDILLFRPTTNDAIQYRIQAKRLHVNVKNWEASSYRELTHPRGLGTQASTLIRSSAHELTPTIPLYAFYNQSSVCKQSGGTISGIELASGLAISAVVKTIVRAKPKRPRLKRISSLRPLFFPFSTILCSGGPGFGILTPFGSRASVQEAIDSRSPSLVDDLVEEEFRRLEPPKLARQIAANVDAESVPPTPERRAALNSVVQAAVENRERERVVRANVKRPKVVLVLD